MTSPLLLTGWLLLTAPALLAQPAPPPPPVRDTAYAVRNLFRERRHKGLQRAGYGFVGLAGSGFELAQGLSGATVVLGLVGALPTALGVRQYWCYSEEREAGVVRQFELGWPLPPGLRRRLRPKHFRATIK